MKPINQIINLLRSHKQFRNKTLNKWRRWAMKILQRRSMLVDLGICAYGKKHIVKKVITIGNGYAFWSNSCNGCPVGAAVIKTYEKCNMSAVLKTPMPEIQHNSCILLKNALLTLEKPIVGQVIFLPEH